MVASKWFYAINVPKKTHLFVGIHQEDERIEGVLPRRPYMDVGLAILKMDPTEGSTIHQWKDYSIQRDSTMEMVLEPGNYIVVPRTSGCNLRRPEWAEAESIKLMDSAGDFHPMFSSTITDIFNKFDLVGHHTIDFGEFKGFLEIIGMTVRNVKEFKETILSKYCSNEEGITLRGFKEWWRQELLSNGEPVIWDHIEKLGYDHDLFSTRSRLFNLVFHSRCLEGDDPIEVRIRDAIGTDIDNRTNELIISQFGHQEAAGDGYKVLSLFSQNSFTFSYAVTNEQADAVEAAIDLSSSENMTFSSKGPMIRKVIKAGETEFMMHAQGGFGNFNKVIRHSIKEIVK